MMAINSNRGTLEGPISQKVINRSDRHTLRNVSKQTVPKMCMIRNSKPQGAAIAHSPWGHLGVLGVSISQTE